VKLQTEVTGLVISGLFALTSFDSLVVLASINISVFIIVTRIIISYCN
jgi:hypothetical protein